MFVIGKIFVFSLSRCKGITQKRTLCSQTGITFHHCLDAIVDCLLDVIGRDNDDIWAIGAEFADQLVVADAINAIDLSSL